MLSLPRYFHPAAGAEPADDAPLDAVLVHVVDAFVLGDREWVVGIDALGRLAAAPGDAPERLHPVARAELSHAEVSGAPRRRIEAKELFLFDLQLVEQPADEPGANDPVFLYGALAGPLPMAPGLPLPTINGQLATTRADVLDGLGAGSSWAFRYPATFGGAPTHCFHLLLPGDREDAIARGSGLVLAYPMMPPEVAVESPANEAMANQVAGDVLRAMVEDLGGKPRGFWTKVFGKDDALEVPEKGSFAEHLALSRKALAALADWPSGRSKALQARVSKAAVVPVKRDVPPPPPPIRTPQPVKPREDGPPAWMRDFLDAHQKPGVAAPRVTTARKAAKPEPAPPKKPDWMKDFE